MGYNCISFVFRLSRRLCGCILYTLISIHSGLHVYHIDVSSYAPTFPVRLRYD